MATGMQPKELCISYLVLCDNTKTQKVSSKSMTMRAKLGLVVTEYCGGGRVVRWSWVNFQCRGVLQF